MYEFGKRMWDWPEGFVWRFTRTLTRASRRKKYNIFYSLISPQEKETILDVGVNAHIGRSTNFLEMWYPYPERITALTVDDPAMFDDFRQAYPKVKLVFGDGRKLNFRDNEFDIVFSNAVVEHVGEKDKQRRLIHEVVRVGKRAIITTPNALFPVDAHTLLPFVHWLPIMVRFFFYKLFDRAYWADINHLNLLTPARFLSLFPPDVKVKLIRQRLLGLSSSLIAVVTKESSLQII